MAASPVLISCYHCSHSAAPESFRNGWRLRSGHLAQLCPRCASVYEDGKFCERFHSDDDGWRDCESCEKAIHCGCVVSFNLYLLLDSEGIICMECSKRSFIMARNKCLPLEALIRVQNAQETRSSYIEPENWPRANDFELQKILNAPNSTITPLFEKVLSASDADVELARLVIPKKCAEAFFPITDEPHGSPIGILDTDSKEWFFLYRCWSNSGVKLHVLEGIRDYMTSKEWKPGDTVTFYRVEPGGKLMMGLRKASEGPAL